MNNVMKKNTSKSKSPYISVIIPTYNEEKYLARCLEAFQKQKTKYLYEILIIDHDSTDRTKAIAKQFQTKIINESRRGTAVARQTGIEAASGDIVAFTEADCTVPSNWITLIGDHFRTHPDDVGVTGRYVFDDANSLSQRHTLASMGFGNYLCRLGQGHYPFRGTNSAGKKSIILKAGGFREESAPFDDADCSTRVAKFGYISFMRNLVVETSSRRIKGRFFSYFF